MTVKDMVNSAVEEYNAAIQSGYKPTKPISNKKATYNLTIDQIEAIHAKGVKEGASEAVPVINAMYSAAMLLEMNSVLGFGRIRLKRMFDRIQMTFKAIYSGEITYSDIDKELKRIGCTIQEQRDIERWTDVSGMFSKIDYKRIMGVRINVKN